MVWCVSGAAPQASEGVVPRPSVGTFPALRSFQFQALLNPDGRQKEAEPPSRRCC